MEVRRLKKFEREEKIRTSTKHNHLLFRSISPLCFQNFISRLPAHSVLVIDPCEDVRSLTTQACPLLKHSLSLASQEFGLNSYQKITFPQNPDAILLQHKNESLSCCTVWIIVNKCTCQRSWGLMCRKLVTVITQALQLHWFKGDKLVPLTNGSGLATAEWGDYQLSLG